ncbi:MAG: hypothetical protein ABIS26_00145, partial [Candidatus Paceibacterota bacterium]
RPLLFPPLLFLAGKREREKELVLLNLFPPYREGARDPDDAGREKLRLFTILLLCHGTPLYHCETQKSEMISISVSLVI